MLGHLKYVFLLIKNTNIISSCNIFVSQAEHDPDSQCILVTKDKNLIKKYYGSSRNLK